MVADSNTLRTEALTSYLSSRKQNGIVICEWVWLEMIKISPEITLTKSLERLRRFPRQIAVSKCGAELAKLDMVPLGINYMIDVDSTRIFPRLLAEAQNSHDPRLLSSEVTALSDIAKSKYNLFSDDPSWMTSTLTLAAEGFTKTELREMNSNGPIDEQVAIKISETAWNVSAGLFNDKTLYKQYSANEMLDSFIYRFSLAMLVMGLVWAANGRQETVKASRLANDFIDAHIAATATLVSGIITSDGKLQRLYDRLMFILTVIKSSGLRSHPDPDVPPLYEAWVERMRRKGHDDGMIIGAIRWHRKGRRAINHGLSLLRS